MNCDNRKIVKLATAIVLSSALGVACCGTRKAAQNEDTPAPPTDKVEVPESAQPSEATESTQLSDTTEQFTPLHPPVVVPHDWRDELKK